MQAYRTLNPPIPCKACGILPSQRRPVQRFCPNPALINTYIQEHTDFTETLSETDRICYTCYLFPTQIINKAQHNSEESEHELDQALKEITFFITQLETLALRNVMKAFWLPEASWSSLFYQILYMLHTFISRLALRRVRQFRYEYLRSTCCVDGWNTRSYIELVTPVSLYHPVKHYDCTGTEVYGLLTCGVRHIPVT